MPEEASGVLGRDRRERSSHRLDQRFAGARLGPSQEPLELREGLLDRVEVRGVGWQVHKLAAAPLDDLPDPLALVGGEVVHHHHPPGRKRRPEDPLQVSLEDFLRRRALHRQAGPDALRGDARQKREVLAPVPRGATEGPLALTRPGVQRRERDVSAHLVDEDQPIRGDLLRHEGTPGGPQELVALTRSHRPFFRLHPRRLSIRLRVDSLTHSPLILPRYSRRSARVAEGRSSTSASKSLLAASSILGLEPGRFLGARGSPRSASLAYRFNEARTTEKARAAS